MPGPPTAWLPKALMDDVSNWDFANTVKNAVGGLADDARGLMQPAVDQVASLLPQPAAPPAPAAPQVPDVPTFSLGKPSDWIAPAQPQQPVSGSDGQPPAAGGSFTLPSPASFFVSPRQQPQAAPVLMGPGPAQSSGPPGPAPAPGGDLRQYARAAAARYGVDPGIFEAQIQQESGFDPKARSGAGAQGIAQFMPATAKGMGLADAFEPYSALDAAARMMQQGLAANGGDYARALAAYNAGQGSVNTYGGVPPFAETRKYVQTILGNARSAPAPAPSAPAPSAPASGGRPPIGTYTPETLVPNQISEGIAQGLSSQQAVAICGPAAAVAFARANGRNPTLKEATDLAQAAGVWDQGSGMHGPASEVDLLGRMGVPAQLAEGADWGQVANEVGQGRPVIIDTPQHYFVASGYDPQTGQFELGQSAAVLSKSGGRTRYRPDELPSLGMGAPRSTIFMRRTP